MTSSACFFCLLPFSMLILGIESTCDETAAALVADGWDVRSNIVATQVELHAKYRGVVPEIASRAHIENLLPVLEAGVTPASPADAAARPASPDTAAEKEDRATQ